MSAPRKGISSDISETVVEIYFIDASKDLARQDFKTFILKYCKNRKRVLNINFIFMSIQEKFSES